MKSATEKFLHKTTPALTDRQGELRACMRSCARRRLGRGTKMVPGKTTFNLIFEQAESKQFLLD
jgi:hypothetical protein